MTEWVSELLTDLIVIRKRCHDETTPAKPCRTYLCEECGEEITDTMSPTIPAVFWHPDMHAAFDVQRA